MIDILFAFFLWNLFLIQSFQIRKITQSQNLIKTTSRIYQFPYAKHHLLSPSSTRLLSSKSEKQPSDPEEKVKRDALELLDCLTSSRDENDPNYDVNKDIRRDEVLRRNDHALLKVQLKARGLRTSGDKLEMIVRLLLHIIDPAINYNEL